MPSDSVHPTADEVSQSKQRLWVRRLVRYAPPFIGILLAVLAVIDLAGHGQHVAAWDFHLYYAAGRIPGPDLYKKDRQMQEEYRIWEENGKSLRPFNYSIYLKPAVYKLVLTPLAKLPFWHAFVSWAVLQGIALCLAMWLIATKCGFPPALWIILPLTPMLATAIAWGQDTGLVFLVLASSWYLGERRRWIAAGSVLGLSLVKWNLFLLLLPVLVVQKQWKMVWGYAGTAATGALLSIYITGISGTIDYFGLLHDGAADYMAPQMPSVRGILLWVGCPPMAVNAAILSLLALSWLLASRLPWRLAFSVGVTACIVLSYHTMLYDLLYMFVPLLLMQKSEIIDSPLFLAMLMIWAEASPFRAPIPQLLTIAIAVLFVVAARRLARLHTDIETERIATPSG